MLNFYDLYTEKKSDFLFNCKILFYIDKVISIFYIYYINNFYISYYNCSINNVTFFTIYFKYISYTINLNLN